MTEWVKVKREELELLLEAAGLNIKSRIIGDAEKAITTCHYLRINQKKIKKSGGVRE